MGRKNESDRAGERDTGILGGVNRRQVIKGRRRGRCHRRSASRPYGRTGSLSPPTTTR